ncbi:MAG: ice-binding family protein, partial [Bacteroidota bacterium]
MNTKLITKINIPQTWKRTLSISITAAVLMAAFVGGCKKEDPVSAGVVDHSAVNLHSSSNFAVLAKSGVSATGVTSIAGDIGLSPAAASYVTGFGLIMDVTNTFATSSLVTASGKIY